MGKIRTFISFDPPAAIQKRLIALQEELKQYRLNGVSWENQKQMHVTIKFLGAVDETLLGPVVAAVERCTQGIDKFVVSFQDLGAFPSKNRPRVIWVGCLSPDGALADLKTKLDSVLQPLGFPIEERSFHPHITLGRVKEEASTRNLLPILEKRTFEPQMAMIDGIFVMKSVLKPSGAEHSIIKTISLAL